MIYYSVGTPIGNLNQKDQRYIHRQNQLFSIDTQAFSIWIDFLHGADIDAVYLRLQADILKDTFDNIVNTLVDTEMLIAQTQLKYARCLRQGYGVGVVASSGECAIFCGSSFSVSYRAFVFWSYCNGGSTVEGIVSRIRSQMKIDYRYQHAFDSINELLRRNLILIVD